MAVLKIGSDHRPLFDYSDLAVLRRFGPISTVYHPENQRVDFNLLGIKWERQASPIAHSFLVEGKTGVLKMIASAIIDKSKELLTGKTPYAAYFRISEDGSKIHVFNEFAYNDRIRAVPGGIWQKDHKHWVYTCTPSTALLLTQSMGGLYVEMDDAFLEVYQSSLGIMDAQQYRDADALPDHPTRVPSWEHQKQAYEFLKRIPCGGLFADMGTGKSKVIVDLLANDPKIQHVLIVCKKKGIGVWPREFRRYSTRKFRIIRLQGNMKSRAQKILDEWDDPEPTVFVTNYEVVWQQPMADVVLSKNWDCVIADEAQKIKSAGSKVSMFMSRLADKTPSRYALTGTPMHDKPIDVYGIYRFIDKGIFGTNFGRFKGRYCIMGGYGGYEIQGYQNLEELASRMYSIAFRVTDEVLDLPEIVFLKDEFSLAKEEMLAYLKMEKDQVLAMMEGDVVANNVLTKMLRLQQITSGFVKTEDEEEIDLGTSKSDYIMEKIEDIPLDEPIVVFCQFIHNLDRVKQMATKLGRRYGEISGRRSDLTADATMPEDIDLMAVQIQSGGDSIDLTRSNRGIFYDIGLSLGNYQQTVKRIHRPGQTRHTFIHHPVALGTIDEGILQMMEEKGDITKYTLNYLKRKAAELAGGKFVVTQGRIN